MQLLTHNFVGEIVLQWEVQIKFLTYSLALRLIILSCHDKQQPNPVKDNHAKM